MPANLTQTGSTTTSVTFAWDAATDNVGVTGYGTYLGATSKGTTTATTTTISGLAVRHELHRRRRRVRRGREPLGQGDTRVPQPRRAPSTPRRRPHPRTSLRSTPPGSSLGLSWSASTDDTAVTGYTLYRDGDEARDHDNDVVQLHRARLRRGYSLGVEASDAAGNTSFRSTITRVDDGVSRHAGAERAGEPDADRQHHLERHLRLGCRRATTSASPATAPTSA